MLSMLKWSVNIFHGPFPFVSAVDGRVRRSQDIQTLRMVRTIRTDRHPIIQIYAVFIIRADRTIHNPFLFKHYHNNMTFWIYLSDIPRCLKS